jgi:hypothetical protein
MKFYFAPAMSLTGLFSAASCAENVTAFVCLDNKIGKKFQQFSYEDLHLTSSSKIFFL